MGTQVLSGSKGNYRLRNPENFGDTAFLVTQDTCLECGELPVKFIEGNIEVSVPMDLVTLSSDAKYQDY